jgi:hypothetical protein
MIARFPLQLDQRIAGADRLAAGSAAPAVVRGECMRAITGDVPGSKRGLHQAMRTGQGTFDERSSRGIGAADSWPLDNRSSGAEFVDRGGRP